MLSRSTPHHETINKSRFIHASIGLMCEVHHESGLLKLMMCVGDHDILNIIPLTRSHGPRKEQLGLKAITIPRFGLDIVHVFTQALLSHSHGHFLVNVTQTILVCSPVEIHAKHLVMRDGRPFHVNDSEHRQSEVTTRKYLLAFDAVEAEHDKCSRYMPLHAHA